MATVWSCRTRRGRSGRREIGTCVARLAGGGGRNSGWLGLQDVVAAEIMAAHLGAMFPGLPR
jgi:hypothetical protein